MKVKLAIFSTQAPFCAELYKVYWAQDASSKQGQLFIPSLEGNFFLVPSQRSPLVTTALCGLAASLSAPGLPMSSCTQACTQPSVTSPLQDGWWVHIITMEQFLPSLCFLPTAWLVSCCFSYWSQSLQKETQLFLHRSWERVRQLQCNII